VHVAGLVDEGVILNSQEPGARVRSLADIASYFARQGCGMEVRGLDKTALAGLAAAGARHGIDAELGRYFEK
jgi:murein DD-endopeptidase